MEENLNYDYKKMYPFKWFILENYPFLEDGIDGLTNYQLFCKLGEEINKNRDAINDIGENEERVVEAYNHLEAYVNNYFNNLNVQDEINNKLDEMASDGTLTTIIGSYCTPFINAQNQEIDNFKNQVNSTINLQNSIISGFSMTPLVASSTDEMTDTSRIYVNTSDGYWYYYNGSAWTQGALYQSEAIDNISYSQLDSNLKAFVDNNIDFSKLITSTVSTTVVNSKSGNLFTTKLTGAGYSAGWSVLNPNYYLYDGFALRNISASPNQGLVIGIVDDDPDDFLFMICSTSQTGSIYRMNHGHNDGKIGTFTNMSNVKDIILHGITNNVLSFTAISISGTSSDRTYDLSSIIDTITPIVGFAPFTTSETTFNYELILYPYANYSDIVSTVNELDNEYNKKDALYYIANEGIKKGTNIQIKLLGDSITAGLGGTGFDDSSSGGGTELFWNKYQNIDGTCWANSLKAYVENKYSNITIKNYGVSGATLHNLNQYYSSVPLVESDDNVVIVMIGTNDRDNTKANYFSNLTTLYNSIKTAGKYMILMTSIPASVSNENNHDYHMEDIAMYNESFARINNIPFINVYDEFIKYCINTGTTIDSYLSDGLHPNDAGYEVMFKIISNKLGFITKRSGADW